MIGGSGERNTLRLVARYADACNRFAGRDTARKLDALRSPASARRATTTRSRRRRRCPTTRRVGRRRCPEALRPQHELGITATYLMIPGPDPAADPTPSATW